MISSDLHQLSVLGPGFDLPTTMSKLLAAGMPLTDVVAATTSRAAAAIGRGDRCGSLAIGRQADIAILRRRADALQLFDSYLQERGGADLLSCEATVVAGRSLPAVDVDMPAPWVSTSSAQRQLLERHLGSLRREPWATQLQARGDFIPMTLSGPPPFAAEHAAPDA